MKVLNLLTGFAKSNGILCLLFFGIATFVFLQSRSEMRSIESQLVADVEAKHSRLIEKILDMNTVNREKYSKVAAYSQWPPLLALGDQHLLDELAKTRTLMQDDCLNASLSIESFDQSLEYWRRVAASERPACYDLLERFDSLYEVSASQSHLTMPDELAEKAKSWLNNEQALFAKMSSQKLLTVANKYTHEENVYNWLRSKRPSQASPVLPKDFYQKTMNESRQTCDFCSKRAAIGNFGRLSSKSSYSAANLFPFHHYHELFMPEKHDFLEMSFPEFADLFDLSNKWFRLVHQADRSHKYPTLLWDLLAKAGASQVHPHLHGVVNKNRYYDMFEVIRNGAEAYFRVTGRNYFSDLLSVHNQLGLTLVHKKAALIIPITPRVANDAIILSETLNEGVIELIFVYLKTLMLDYQVFPFSLTIYYPSMDKNETEGGRIPLYVKIMPRGDIASAKSDTSTLELMSIHNVNADQFQVGAKTFALLRQRLDKLET